MILGTGRTIEDEPVRASNKPGFASFAQTSYGENRQDMQYRITTEGRLDYILSAVIE